MSRHPAFKAYDVRGRVGIDLDDALMTRIGAAVVAELGAASVVLGHDARTTSPAFADAVARGAMAAGAEVLDLGLCGTEEVYFATSHLGAGAGLMVTASHNPIDWNGLKLVREESRPIAWETGLSAIHHRVMAGGDPGPARAGRRAVDIRPAYAAHVAGYADAAHWRPMRVLAHAGNGAAGPTFDAVVAALADRGLPLEVVRLDWEPDGTFPHGIPNPLLPEMRHRTAAALRESRAEMAFAWDGDFDRCFFFDEQGDFVAGEHVVALLARAMLAREPGAPIVHEPRTVWATEDAIQSAGGRPVLTRTGHAHFKAALRETGAPYGGEMSAHHYFRDFACCDSGLIPALLIASLVARSGRSLSSLVGEMRVFYPSSGEINFAVPDPAAKLPVIEAAYGAAARAVDLTDGLSVDMGEWRFNLRVSNTEGLLRLNVESRGDRRLLADKVAELSRRIEG